MASIDEMIRSFVASWNESDPAKRELTIEKTWSPDGVYRNETAEFGGHVGIARAVTAAHDAFVANGFVFTLANVDINHDAVRYRWRCFRQAAASAIRSGPTSPSSVPTAVWSVTTSSSISRRQRARWDPQASSGETTPARLRNTGCLAPAALLIAFRSIRADRRRRSASHVGRQAWWCARRSCVVRDGAPSARALLRRAATGR